MSLRQTFGKPVSAQVNRPANPFEGRVDAVWRLTLPGMAAPGAWIYAVVGLIALLASGWLAFQQVRASQAPPTVKIGLVAPFEGLYRSTGYEVLFAVKLALQERNQGQGVGGYRVELVALNDFNDPAEAQVQAQALIADPEVMGVVGHLTSAATLAALPIYRQADLAVVIPWSAALSETGGQGQGVVTVAATPDELHAALDTVAAQLGVETVIPLENRSDLATVTAKTDAVRLKTDAVLAGQLLVDLLAVNPAGLRFGEVETGNRQLVQVAGAAADGLIFVSPGPDAGHTTGGQPFIEAYQALAGFPPGPRAILAYDAAQVLLDSIELTMQFEEKWYNDALSREKISQMLPEVRRQGLSGNISFEPDGFRSDAPIWIYQISQTEYPGILLDR